MIIRRMFGQAFLGKQLVNKAISPDSPYYSDSDRSATIKGIIDSLMP